MSLIEFRKLRLGLVLLVLLLSVISILSQDRLDLKAHLGLNSTQDHSSFSHQSPSPLSSQSVGSLNQTTGVDSNVRDRLGRSVDDQGQSARGPFFKSQLEALIKDATREMPTLEDLQQLSSEEVHSMPEPVRRAAHRLALIAEFLEQHPELNADAQEFYSGCALESKYPTSLRALCYSHVIPQVSDEQRRRLEKELPKDVQQIAERL